jgi:hypothetical protein
MSTFKQIETALEKSEELLNGIPKKKKIWIKIVQ